MHCVQNSSVLQKKLLDSADETPNFTLFLRCLPRTPNNSGVDTSDTGDSVDDTDDTNDTEDTDTDDTDTETDTDTDDTAPPVIVLEEEPGLWRHPNWCPIRAT